MADCYNPHCIKGYLEDIGDITESTGDIVGSLEGTGDITKSTGGSLEEGTVDVVVSLECTGGDVVVVGLGLLAFGRSFPRSVSKTRVCSREHGVDKKTNMI